MAGTLMITHTQQVTVKVAGTQANVDAAAELAEDLIVCVVGMINVKINWTPTWLGALKITIDLKAASPAALDRAVAMIADRVTRA